MHIVRWSSTTGATQVPFPIFRDVPQLREARKKMFREGKEVGFVATMGALHDGHVSLVKHALEENTDVFVSIFVNPTQFAVHEDLDAYPQTWEEDLKKLKQIQDEHAASSGPNSNSRIRGIFAPTVKVMYPTLPPSSDIAGYGSFVTITPLGNQLEGASRPIFFRGVATVCTKLFNVIQADRVYFGQKDVQQSVVIKRMVKDFLIPTEVRVVPTSREPDGLAMSSRNVYLGERRRKDAVVLSKALFAARELYNAGELRGKVIRDAAFEVFHRETLAKRKDGKLESSCRIEIDYIALSEPENMTMIRDFDKIDPRRGAILSAAVYVQPVDEPKNQDELDQRLVRLIDNVIFEPREGTRH
ncbi:pantoate-beta-alanine ligase [Exophiala viscosa]|uniref:Pantoate--beta-alanine ligase n=1 Tax=Exophiala viscosa TaxID=2486360 RepID=A0AAN6IF09_9EURO|nr:pantoate-beta-alanine ligase [Exophiala viscosa]KAI1624036.1 pantoate-beta-alanine ligase [Exophiala viscosa]